MVIQRAYKTELDPNNEQTVLCYKSAGVARYAYNWGLSRKKEYYEQHGKSLSLNDLKKDWNARKAAEFPWAYEVSTHCMQSAMADLERAFQNFFRRLKNGEKPGYPRFKNKYTSRRSFRLYGVIRVGERHIQLPNLGRVRLKEKGYLPQDGVKVISATVSERAGRWYVSLQVEEEVPNPQPRETEPVGVDMGIHALAVVSDGTRYPNPKPLAQAQRKLRRLQRALSRKQKGSANRKKAARKVAKLHARVANIRQHALHTATTDLTRRHGVVILEGLNIRGMLQNRRLARAISDCGWHEFRRQVEYKLQWTGGRTTTVSQWFPSSKTCSHCGQVRSELKLSERVFRCPSCGFTADRDWNAALNLRAVAAKVAETQNDCGGGVSVASAAVAPDETVIPTDVGRLDLGSPGTPGGQT